LSFQIGTRIGRFSLEIKPRGSNTEQYGAGAGSDSDDNTIRILASSEGIINQQRQSPLFKLPAELRFAIYEHVLRLPLDGASYRQIVYHPSCGHQRFNSVLNLIATCRLIQLEAEELFYSLNRHRIVQLTEFSASLSVRRRHAIAHIALCVVSAGEMLTMLQGLQGFPNLETLLVERLMTIRYIDPRSWAVLTPNMVTEVKKFTKLRSVRIVTPMIAELSDDESKRLEKLEFHDARIVAAAAGASMRSATLPGTS
jgi:hypothetical protein